MAWRYCLLVRKRFNVKTIYLFVCPYPEVFYRSQKYKLLPIFLFFDSFKKTEDFGTLKLLKYFRIAPPRAKFLNNIPRKANIEFKSNSFSISGRQAGIVREISDKWIRKLPKWNNTDSERNPWRSGPLILRSNHWTVQGITAKLNHETQIAYIKS